MVEDEFVALSNSFIQLEYMTQKSQQGQSSKAAMTMNAAYQQHSSNEDLALNQPNTNNMFNTQLNYDIN